MQCRDFRRIACSFLDDELLIETNHDVIRHLEECAECRRELTARREMRLKLCSAIAHAPELQMSDEFVKHLRAKLQTQSPRRKLLDIFKKRSK